MPFHIAAQTSGAADFGKRSIAVVFVEQVDSDGGDQDIRIAVVIVVGGVRAGSPVGVRETRTYGNIFEPSVPKIMEQVYAAWGWRGRLSRHDAAQLLHARPVHDQQIHEAVVVVIEPGGAAAIGLRDPAFFGTTATHLGMNSGGVGDVCELNSRCGAG